ncbi:MAG: glycoside hydrolase, partial [Thermoplasmata archaeon]|nr:glycoside hydrolase [Thermoplasmata archaeon]
MPAPSPQSADKTLTEMETERPSNRAETISRPSAFSRGRTVLALLILTTVLTGMIFGGSGLVGAAALTPSATPTHLTGTGTAPSASTAAAPAAPTTSGNSSGLYFQNTSNVAYSNFNYSNEVCWMYEYFYGYSACYYYYEESSSPSLMALPDGDIGMSYQVMVNTSQSICGMSVNQTVSHIAFANSTDGGSTWGVPTYLGDSPSTCPYNEELEPSFTTNGSGAVLGVYVGANANLTNFGNSSNGPYVCGALGCYRTTVSNPIVGYTNRSSDALIFINSSNSGASFSNGTAIVTGANLARPAIASFGQTIYIAYEDINNSSTANPDGTYPISVQFVDSTNGGATWSAPTILPGENSSEGYTAMSPSISVSSTGEVAVAYVTNRSCLSNCTPGTIGPDSNFGDDVVAATSTNNGSAWAL